VKEYELYMEKFAITEWRDGCVFRTRKRVFIARSSLERIRKLGEESRPGL
jgi:hypothetical protein